MKEIVKALKGLSREQLEAIKALVSKHHRSDVLGVLIAVEAEAELRELDAASGEDEETSSSAGPDGAAPSSKTDASEDIFVAAEPGA